jgi:hypothetical protein
MIFINVNSIAQPFPNAPLSAACSWAYATFSDTKYFESASAFHFLILVSTSSTAQAGLRWIALPPL